MYLYAIQEVHTILKYLPSPMDDRSAQIRYLCALFAELPYYHIPQWEVDNQKRAKLIPCDAYRVLVAGGVPANVSTTFQQLDFPIAFVVVDRGVIAVGSIVDRILFIGFRGTQFLFDWKINFQSRLIPINARIQVRPPFFLNSNLGRIHSGFGEEAFRVATKIRDAIRDSKIGDIDHVFLVGHSLGGAVAAIAENYLRVAPSSVCMFGAPRYSDLSAYASLPNGPPTQVRRPGDVIPTVPPKLFGYVDHPYEFGTDGTVYDDPLPFVGLSGGMFRWAKFLTNRFEPHDMEAYRHEVGAAASAAGATLPLAPIPKLTKLDVSPS
jgi:pimeloyl-ACP methyl ester carboxylesterase